MTALLVYIDKTISEYLSGNQLSDSQQALFSDLALAYRRGKLIVYGDINSLDAIINQLGEPSKSIFYRIRSKNPETGAVADKVNKAIIISMTNNASKELIIPKALKGKEQVITIETACSWAWGFGSCLVAESMADCIFYKYVGQYYCKNNKIRNVPIEYHFESGGGGAIRDVFEKCILIDHVPTLCIVDSDMKWERSDKYGDPPFGDTYRAAKEVAESLRRSHFENQFDFFCLKCHEIENLISISLLEQLDADICFEDGLDLIKKLTKYKHGNPILFYDFKKGVNTHRGDQCSCYWSSVFDELEIPQEKENCRVGCEHLLERTNDYIERHSIAQIEIDDYLLDLWEELGKIIFTWGCVSSPMRS